MKTAFVKMCGVRAHHGLATLALVGGCLRCLVLRPLLLSLEVELGQAGLVLHSAA
jgi:hypothetical protein